MEKQEKIKVSYDTIWWPLFERFDLSPLEGVLLTFINGLTRLGGYCYMSQNTMAQKLKTTRPTIGHAIKVLEKKDLIRREGESSRGRAKSIYMTTTWRSFEEEMRRAVELKKQGFKY